MKLPPEFFDLIKSRVKLSDIVSKYVHLTKRNDEYVGLCPFHVEKTPSFTINDMKKFYYCFGCGAHGDIIKFISELNGLGRVKAAINIANEHGIEIPTESPHMRDIYNEIDEVSRILEIAAQFFHQHLSIEVVKYINSRGVNNEYIKHFMLGFGKEGLIKFMENKGMPLSLLYKAGLVSKHNENIYEIFRNRIIFPIKNSYGKIIAFGGRALNEIGAKYLNSPETLVFKKSEIFYGEDIATSSGYRKKRMIIVEGYFDLIFMHMAGFTETIASLGTAMNAARLKRLWETIDEIVICLDGDNAGLKAASNILHMSLPLVSSAKSISFIFLSENMDPEDVIKVKGKDYMSNIIENRLSLAQSLWYIETLGKSFVTPESIAALESCLMNYLSVMQNKILARTYSFFFRNKCFELSRSKKKVMEIVTSSQNFNKNINNNESDNLEFNVFSVIIKFPELLESENIMEDFLRLELSRSDLINFRVWIIDAKDQGGSNGAIFKKLVQMSQFYELYTILLEFNKNKTNMESNILWDIALKMYYLFNLKQEYVNISKTTGGANLAFNYWQEITKLQKAINEAIGIE